jgi:hypothetical protein
LDTVAGSAAAVGDASGDRAAFASHEATPNAITAVTVATPRIQPHLGYLIDCSPQVDLWVSMFAEPDQRYIPQRRQMI